MTNGTIANNEMRTFINGTVQLTEGEQFSQYNNLRRINLYLRGQYMDCDDDTAFFWQLGTPRVPLYAKSIDMDSKNFSMIGIGKFNWFKAFIANARFRQWTKDELFAITLDDTSTGIGNYGSMVWKKSYDNKGKVQLEESNLQNLYFDQTVKNIIDSPVVEAHYLTETEIRSRFPEQATDILKKAPEARDADDNKAESEDEKYMILERWGEVENDKQKMEYRHQITAGEGDAEVSIVDDLIKINADGKPKDFPYYDFHGERVPGRWQGMGVIERLYGLQEQINKLVNQNDNANDIATLLLFLTSDPNTTGNILDSARPGQIINSDDMKQLIADNRFSGTFLNQLQSIERKADELCYINDSISGDTPPSGVPFRSLAVATRAAKSTFTYIKTSIGEKMGVVLQLEIMPDVVKDFKKEDLFDIMESNADLAQYDTMKIEDGIKKFMKKKAKEGKTVVFQQDIAKEAERIQVELERGGRQEKVDIDFNWGIRMNPTGESVDKNTKNAAIDGALEVMSLNPALVNTPLFQQKLENNGIPSFRLTPLQQQQLEQSEGTKLPETGEVDKLSQLAEE